MSSRESKKIIRRYNRLAETLIQAETVWYTNWRRSLEDLEASISSPVLAWSEGKLVVNLDRKSLLALQEVDQFGRLGLQSPLGPETLQRLRSRLQTNYNRLARCLNVSVIVAASAHWPKLCQLNWVFRLAHTGLGLRAVQHPKRAAIPSGKLPWIWT